MRNISDDRAVVVTPLRMEVSAIELRISEVGPQIGSRKEVILTAERIIFDAPLVASGAYVQIVACELVGGSNARIDVSGVDGADAPRSPKPKPALGKHKAKVDGADGGDAGSAGRVEILGRSLKGPLQVIARGGEGGTAQPGGDGADGRPGAPGRSPRNIFDGQGGPGGDGGPAGTAGMAGDPGASGNGGTITIMLAEGMDRVMVDVSGGPEVPPTRHGRPGNPGKKGRGGRRTKCHSVVNPCVV